MKKFIILLLAFAGVLAISAQQQVQTPAEIYGELFTDVQMRHVFPDSKTFADCTPKRDPKQIVKDYLAMKNDSNIRFKLDEFVMGNFDLPKAPQLNYVTQEKDVVMHIKNLWNVLRRDADSAVNGSSLLPLPNPYIVPGGRFGEIYYWDSYFTMLGLKEERESGHDRKHGEELCISHQYLWSYPQWKSQLLHQPVATAIFFFNGRIACIDQRG
jgi:alpha,alpha-trehalase